MNIQDLSFDDLSREVVFYIHIGDTRHQKTGRLDAYMRNGNVIVSVLESVKKKNVRVKYEIAATDCYFTDLITRDYSGRD